MEKFEQERVSENEDDPDVYESSGDEWNEEVEEKKGGNRRSSKRLSKKPRVTHAEMSSESEGDSKGKKSKNGIKRQKLDEEEPEEDIEDEEDIEEEEEEEDEESSENQTNNKAASKKSSSKNSDFVNGGFLILKKDADAGNKTLCLWRIDGKALLQKYEAFEEEGQTRHRNTSIYTGWSSLDKDLYYPVVVKVLRHQGQNMTVELNWEKLKEMHNESE